MATRSALRSSILVCLALGTLAARPSAPRTDKPSVRAVVAATQAYVAAFESKLAYGVFDENYAQEVTNGAGRGERDIRGELFLTFLPEDGDWVAVHDFAEVDGTPVPDHQSLATLLDRGSLESIE